MWHIIIKAVDYSKSFFLLEMFFFSRFWLGFIFVRNDNYLPYVTIDNGNGMVLIRPVGRPLGPSKEMEPFVTGRPQLLTPTGTVAVHRNYFSSVHDELQYRNSQLTFHISLLQSHSSITIQIFNLNTIQFVLHSVSGFPICD